MKMKILISCNVFLLLVLFVTQFGCNFKNASTAAQADASPTPQVVPVKIELVSTGEMISSIETTSNVEAENDVVIYSKSSGQVEKILVQEGSVVSKNQPLALLDDDAFKLYYQQSVVDHQQDTENFKRIESLYKEKMISEQEYLDFKYKMEQSGVALNIAKLDLDNTRIEAPFDGIIVSKFISEGDLIQGSTKLFRIFDPQSLIVNIFLPESDTHILQIGMKADIMPESLPGISWSAEILRINPAVDPRTGTVKITLKINQTDQTQIRTGTFVKVRLILSRKMDVILVPKKATLRRNGSTEIFVVDTDSRAHLKIIKTGLENDMYFEVSEGVEPGEHVIVVGQQNLEDGILVKETNGSSVSEPSFDDSDPETTMVETPGLSHSSTNNE